MAVRIKGAGVLTTEDFIKKAKAKHGDKYDYSEVEYLGSRQVVWLYCPEHGRFSQIADSHLQGKGCYSCGRLASGKRLSLRAEGFRKKANEIHNNFYDYSSVDYKNAKEKVSIHCPLHGPFLQRANSHLSGDGCPKCGLSKRRGFPDSQKSSASLGDEATLYLVNLSPKEGRDFHKIGVTTASVAERFKAARGKGYRVELLESWDFTLAECLALEEIILETLEERELTYQVTSLKDDGVSGWTECFYPEDRGAEQWF